MGIGFPKRLFFLFDLWLTKLEENSFQLIGKNNVITISASNTKEKDEWIEDIEKTINALIESNQYDMKGLR